MAEYADLIGKTFEYGGRGPDKYDCYGLVKEMMERDGKVAPDYKSPSEAPAIVAMILHKRKFWQECECKPGAVAVIKLHKNLHVGYILPHGKFIHTWERSGGVTVERLREWQHRVMACYEFTGTT